MIEYFELYISPILRLELTRDSAFKKFCILRYLAIKYIIVKCRMILFLQKNLFLRLGNIAVKVKKVFCVRVFIRNHHLF